MFRNIAKLEAYYWVARLGSFQAAAEHLGLSQPSISIRVKELESHAKTALFIRDNRGAHLTDHGRAIYEHVERVISLLYDLGGYLGHTGPLRGHLRVGVPDSFALCCLPAFVELLEQKHPELNIDIHVENSRNLVQKLEENRLDMAVLVQPTLSSAFRVESLGHQTLTWVASPALSSSLQDLEPNDLCHRRIFTNPSPSPSFAVLMDWFAHHGSIPARISTCSSMATIILVTMAGQGVSILPKCVVQQQLQDKKLIVFDPSPALPKQEMFVVYSQGIINQGVKQIISLIKESLHGTGFVEGL